MGRRVPSIELVPKVLEGDVRSLSRMMTRVELQDPECREAMIEIFRHTGRAQIIGITGVPGSGKSTLVSHLVKLARKSGRKVGVVAIDPSSPYSGGAILGDRVRMADVAVDQGVFIRSMATRGALGGLARSALDAVDILDAAGYDLVLIETVGVGQDEVDIAGATLTTVVVSAPGLGDEIQAIKAGILEIADIHVVSKCDRPDANRLITELKHMLMLGLSASGVPPWQVPVIATSGQDRTGIDELLSAIDRHFAYLQTDGAMRQRRKLLATRRTYKTAEEILRRNWFDWEESCNEAVEDQISRVCKREIDPHSAALALIKLLRGDTKP